VQYEVEQKFRVEDRSPLEKHLHKLGGVLGLPVVHADVYFRHPARDFARTDEALRIRSVGDEHWITYKGPKIDRELKTRAELELPLGSGQQSLAGFTELLTSLGFDPVREVRKTRQPFRVAWRGVNIEGALDNVDGLGQFVELEIIADAAGLDAARQSILSLAEELDLASPERRSYLEMLIDVDRG
jgi:adenylate cyclase, class 2